MKKRILVISWFFPPVNSSEGLVTYKLLNNSKNNYDVFTQKSNNSWAYKQSDNLYINDNINRIYSNAKDLDEYYEEAIEYYNKNVDKYDVVMTRSMPEISHEIGLKIKKINPSVIWIASFGDPISNNPFTKKACSMTNPFSLKQRYERKMSVKEIISPKRIIKSFICRIRIKKMNRNIFKKNEILQRNVVENCDKIIFNSEYQKNYMLSEYPVYLNLDKKSIVLPHSFDEKLYGNENKEKNEKMVFSYVGHLDDIRTPRLLFEALKELKKNDDSLSNRVEFNFYGNLSDNDKLYLINNDLIDIVKIKKNITYIESLNVMQKSDWLIHIDANISDMILSNIFFAAKLVDYLGSKKPIMGITMLEGISADILRENDGLVISHSIEDIKNYLYLIIYNNYKINMSSICREEYNAIKVAHTFDKIIEKI